MYFNPRRGLKRLVVLGLAVALTVAMGWGLLSPKRPPDLTLTTIQGEKFHLHELRGQPVLLAFWATDCPACLREIPILQAIQQDYGPRGLKIFAVAMPYDPPSRVVAYTQTHALGYPIVLDPVGTIADTFDIALIPSLILIAPDGTLIMQHTGLPDTVGLRNLIEEQLERGEA